MTVKRTIIISGCPEWVKGVLDKSLVGPGKPIFQTPKGYITETKRKEHTTT